MKIKRHLKIIELVKNNNIETQEELSEKLKENGFNVTQATVSRDIRELKLSKMSCDGGKQKYVIFNTNDGNVTQRLIRIFRDGVTSIDYAQNIIVIKTLNGMAMAVAAALDAMNNSEIIGSIAGDDTIFCVVKTEQKAIELIERLKVETKLI